MLNHREEVYYMRELVYLEYEKDLQYLQDLEEWQEQQRKEAQILLIKVEEETPDKVCTVKHLK